MFCLTRNQFILKAIENRIKINEHLNVDYVKHLGTTHQKCDKHVISYERVEPFHRNDKKRLIPQHICRPSYADSGLVSKSSYNNLIKTKEQIHGISNSCKIAKQILTNVGKHLKPGISGEDIDDMVFELCLAHDCYPSPLNYKGFPKCVTTSVNNIAVHGIPDSRQLINGDIITVDVSIFFKGFHGDCAHTFLIGDCDLNAKHLLNVAQLCLYRAIKVCKDGQPLAIIGKTIERTAKQNGLNVIEAFCGHGVGANLHEPPQILHYDNNSSEVMYEDMVFTIEPVITEGEADVVVDDDNWTVYTEDNCRTAQFEHTIRVTKDEPIILTLDSNQVNQ